MIKALVRGKNTDIVTAILNGYKVKIVDKDPNIIIAYGGDGTLLESERLYPNIPKLAIRDIHTAPLCKDHSLNGIIEDFISKKLKKKKLLKISGHCDSVNQTIDGMNDIFIHNVIRNNAIRYKVYIDGEIYLREVASDCIGFATPHGSTGYFQSITHCSFKQGIGIAFSNSREHVNHIIIKENSEIKIEILRGPAIMVADNNPNLIKLKDGDTLTIKKAAHEPVIYGLEAFMCNKCRKLRHIKI